MPIYIEERASFLANKGFFRTVKAFSRRAAILAGTLAAAFFASSALFSCSDLNGGYGGTDQGENSSVLVLGDLPAGMGRVCGKIKDRQEQNSASKNTKRKAFVAYAFSSYTSG